jgi:hypothetical protein
MVKCSVRRFLGTSARDQPLELSDEMMCVNPIKGMEVSLGRI